MPAAAKKQPPKVSEREALCRELLEIRRDNFKIFSRIDAIGTRLKVIAGGIDESFRETFVGLGYVSVTPAKLAQTLGSQPVLQVAAWNGLSDARQTRLVDQGLVTIKAIVKKATYGQVRPKLHAEPEGDDT